MSIKNFILTDPEGIIVIKKDESVIYEPTQGQTIPTPVSKVDTVSGKALKG
jgi:hypothetical protein